MCNSSIRVSSEVSNLIRRSQISLFLLIELFPIYPLTKKPYKVDILEDVFQELQSTRRHDFLLGVWWKRKRELKNDRSITYSAENLPNRPEDSLRLIGEFSRHFENNNHLSSIKMWETFFFLWHTCPHSEWVQMDWKDDSDRKCNSLVKCCTFFPPKSVGRAGNVEVKNRVTARQRGNDTEFL